MGRLLRGRSAAGTSPSVPDRRGKPRNSKWRKRLKRPRRPSVFANGIPPIADMAGPVRTGRAGPAVYRSLVGQLIEAGDVVLRDGRGVLLALWLVARIYATGNAAGLVERRP